MPSVFPALVTAETRRRCALADGNGGLFVALRIERAAGVPGPEILHVPALGATPVRFSPFSAGIEDVNGLDRLPGGGFVAVVRDTSLDWRLIRLDPAVPVQWETEIPRNSLFTLVADVTASAGGSIYLSFSEFGPLPVGFQGEDLLRFDGASGSFEWTIDLDARTPRSSALDLLAPPDDGVLVAGAMTSPSGSQPLLQRFDAAGSLLLSQTLEGSGVGATSLTRIVADGDDWLVARARAALSSQGEPAGTEVIRLEGLDGVGQAYCGPAVANSTGQSGATRAFGSVIAAENNLVLRSSSLPPAVFGLYVLGSEQGLSPIGGGSTGRLCIAGTLGRIADSIRQVALDGTATYAVDLSALPTSAGPVSAVAGDRWNFQFWHRDDPAVSSSNATDAVSLTLQ